MEKNRVRVLPQIASRFLGSTGVDVVPLGVATMGIQDGKVEVRFLTRAQTQRNLLSCVAGLGGS